MAAIHPQKIVGNWQAGIALDFHTSHSIPIGPNDQGHMQFDTLRPEIAELLYRLKYRGDLAAAQDIIATAATFLRRHRAKFDMMVPVPASAFRPVQPVLVLANGIGAAIGLPVVQCVTTTRFTPATEERDRFGAAEGTAGGPVPGRCPSHHRQECPAVR